MWHCTGVFPVCGNNRSGGCGRILSAYISYYKCGTIYIFKVLVPMIKVYVTINLINNISKEDFLSKTSGFAEKRIAFINKIRRRYSCWS